MFKIAGTLVIFLLTLIDGSVSLIFKFVSYVYMTFLPELWWLLLGDCLKKHINLNFCFLCTISFKTHTNTWGNMTNNDCSQLSAVAVTVSKLELFLSILAFMLINAQYWMIILLIEYWLICISPEEILFLPSKFSSWYYPCNNQNQKKLYCILQKAA